MIEQVNNLANRAVVAKMSVHLMSFSERDKKTTRRVNEEFLKTSQESGNYQKIRLDRKDLADILSIIDKTRLYFRSQTRPFGDDGVRLLPVSFVYEYTKKMGELKREFEEEVERVSQNWDAIVARQAVRLGDMFNPERYPSSKQVSRKFKMSWSIMPVPDWTQAHDENHVLLSIQKDIADDIMAQVKEDQERLLFESQIVLWQRLHDVVSKMATRFLNENGQVYRSALVNIEKTISIVKELNFTDDPELTAVCVEIDQSLLGWLPKQIRHDLDLKLKLGRRAEAIADKIRARMETGLPI